MALLCFNFFKELRYLPDFVKLSHSVFALPFALSALILASKGFPKIRILLLVVGAVVTARLVAMAFNRIVDAKYDAANPRTRERHLPTGKISFATAWAIIGLSSLLFVWIAFSINKVAGFLSPIALIIVGGYSFTKRFTYFSHFFLGAALGLAPLGAWLAARGHLADPIPWLLALAVICWVAGFDMIYALQDAAFDKTYGLYSMIVLLGVNRAMHWVQFLHVLMFLILVVIGLLLSLKPPYFLGLLVVLAALLWEHGLIRRLNQNNLQLAFLQANAMASFGYLAAVLLGVFAS